MSGFDVSGQNCYRRDGRRYRREGESREKKEEESEIECPDVRRLFRLFTSAVVVLGNSSPSN